MIRPELSTHVNWTPGCCPPELMSWHSPRSTAFSQPASPGKHDHDRPAGRAMVSLTLTPKRALRKPWRLDPRAVFGLFLMLVSVAGSVAFWTASTDTRAVLVVKRDRPAGATLNSADVAVANVRVDDA